MSFATASSLVQHLLAYSLFGLVGLTTLALFGISGTALVQSVRAGHARA